MPTSGGFPAKNVSLQHNMTSSGKSVLPCDKTCKPIFLDDYFVTSTAYFYSLQTEKYFKGVGEAFKLMDLLTRRPGLYFMSHGQVPQEKPAQ